MNIAVIGGGAIGSIVAAELTKVGEDVLLVARPDHARAINNKGLRVIRPDGSAETIQVRAAERLDRAYALTIFATKSQDLESSYQDNNEFLEKTWVLTTQNGVQGDNLLRTHFEPDDMISSIVMFGATYTKPGEVTYNFTGDWILGRPFSTIDPKTHEVGGILKKAFPIVVSNNITGMKWLKLFVNFNNCLPALIGKSMQETYSDLDFCRISVQLLREGLKVIKDADIELVSLPNFPVERILGMAQMPVEQAAGILNKTLPGLSKEPLYGSILQSIMRGKPSEIDFINGEVVLIGGNIGSPAPLNSKVVDMVHQVEISGKYFSKEEVKELLISEKSSVKSE